jgi:hypothetical protein
MEPTANPTQPVSPDRPPSVRVTLLLADSAQVADGKLFILGGGITAVGPRPQPMGVAIRIEVPWDRANVPHLWRLDLLDEDGHPLMVRDKALVVHGRFEAGRPAGLKPGTPLSVPLAINFPTIPATPGKSYRFSFEASPGHRLSFATMYVQSNDGFYAPPDSGLPLYSGTTPVTGNVTSQISLWDAGTEVNQQPGSGPDQAPRQSGPNTGPSERANVDLINTRDSFSYGTALEVTVQVQ